MKKNYLVHINSDFTWNVHVEKVAIEVKKRIGLLRRIRERIPKAKLVMIAEAIFNSKICFGISVYLNPVLYNEDLKAKIKRKNQNVLSQPDVCLPYHT